MNTLLANAGLSAAEITAFETELTTILNTAYFIAHRVVFYSIAPDTATTKAYHYVEFPDRSASIINGEQVQSSDPDILADTDVTITEALPFEPAAFPYARHGRGIVVTAIEEDETLEVKTSCAERSFANIDYDIANDAKALLFAVKIHDTEGIYAALQKLRTSKQHRTLEGGIMPAPTPPVSFELTPMEL